MVMYLIGVMIVTIYDIIVIGIIAYTNAYPLAHSIVVVERLMRYAEHIHIPRAEYTASGILLFMDIEL